ncbi:MAG: rod shape-determining protein MreC [Anaerolineaceae bacterium]|nr:rod shape-determining protein MreC [Anaerolineaceae bacterium]
MNLPFRRYWQTALLVMVVVGILVLALSGYLGPLLRLALNPLVSTQGWLSSRYMAVYEFVTVPRDVASLRARNAQLENDVSRLQTQVIQLQQQQRQAQVLYALLNFARANPENEYVAAAVIGRDPSPFLHYVIIDHGSDDGIRHGMPVVTEQGLVGRVDAVTAGAARIQLINDPGSQINVKLQSSQTEVMLTGSITGDINLGMIPQDLNLQPGEVVLTSGLGGDYPQEVVVGQVITVRKIQTDLFQTASVQPAVDFNTLQAVLIITNFKPVDVTPLIPTTSP